MQAHHELKNTYDDTSQPENLICSTEPPSDVHCILSHLISMINNRQRLSCLAARTLHSRAFRSQKNLALAATTIQARASSRSWIWHMNCRAGNACLHACTSSAPQRASCCLAEHVSHVTGKVKTCCHAPQLSRRTGRAPPCAVSPLLARPRPSVDTTARLPTVSQPLRSLLPGSAHPQAGKPTGL
jgi:hypothetical protein